MRSLCLPGVLGADGWVWASRGSRPAGRDDCLGVVVSVLLPTLSLSLRILFLFYRKGGGRVSWGHGMRCDLSFWYVACLGGSCV